jgi:hypothetical protein
MDLGLTRFSVGVQAFQEVRPRHQPSQAMHWSCTLWLVHRPSCFTRNFVLHTVCRTASMHLLQNNSPNSAHGALHVCWHDP